MSDKYVLRADSLDLPVSCHFSSDVTAEEAFTKACTVHEIDPSKEHASFFKVGKLHMDHLGGWREPGTWVVGP